VDCKKKGKKPGIHLKNGTKNLGKDANLSPPEGKKVHPQNLTHGTHHLFARNEPLVGSLAFADHHGDHTLPLDAHDVAAEARENVSPLPPLISDLLPEEEAAISSPIAQQNDQVSHELLALYLHSSEISPRSWSQSRGAESRGGGQTQRRLTDSEWDGDRPRREGNG
jgi:hypothetical protein